MCVISLLFFVKGKVTLWIERREDFSNGEVAQSANIFMPGGVSWSVLVSCLLMGDVYTCDETINVSLEVCVHNLSGVDVLGPCVAKAESVLTSCSATVLLSAS